MAVALNMVGFIVLNRTGFRRNPVYDSFTLFLIHFGFPRREIVTGWPDSAIRSQTDGRWVLASKMPMVFMGLTNQMVGWLSS